ncbi:MAG: glycosyltransferase family 9 protein [Odoribacter splanchnicus]
MPKFLIIRFSSIGDIIQCMGIIDGIREHFPDAEIHWIARKDMSSFLAMDKRIGKIWAFDKALGLKGLLKIARQLREEHYDYIYDAHSNIRSNILRLKLLPWWSKGPHFTLRSRTLERFYFSIGISIGFWPFQCRFLPETAQNGDRPFRILTTTGISRKISRKS